MGEAGWVASAPAVHFPGLVPVGLCLGSRGSGEGRGSLWRNAPSLWHHGCAQASSRWGRHWVWLHPGAMPAPLPWGIPKRGKQRCCGPHAAVPVLGAHPAVPPCKRRQARSCRAVPGALGTRRRWLTNPRGALLFTGGAAVLPAGRGVPALTTPGWSGFRGQAGSGGLQAEGIGSDIPVAWRLPSLSAGSPFE